MGMTTIYSPENGAQNVTLIECEPNKVSFVRTTEKDGYSAIQLEVQKTKNVAYRCEFAKDEESSLALGDQVTLENFVVGDLVKVSGIAKAKGFQGVVKRHGFKGSPATHGHKHDNRAPGSIGAQQPQHVIKGKRMAGRMGGKRKSSMNIEVVYIDLSKNILGVKGAVPGVVGRIVEIVA